MKTIDDALKYADTFDSPHNQHMSIVMLASEVRRLRDEINGLTGSLDRTEKALKEAQEQEPCAFWWIGPDGKDNGGPYRGKPSDFAIDNARNMGCEPVLLYARPVPAVPDANPVQWLEDEGDMILVPRGLREYLDIKCYCRSCNPDAVMMILCPTCGNKRCPHANDHRNACTGSNEPGQPGSDYPIGDAK